MAKKKDNTLLYIAAGLAGVYIVGKTLQPRQQFTQPQIPVTPERNVWDAVSTGLGALFGYLGSRPPRTNGMLTDSASERVIFSEQVKYN